MNVEGSYEYVIRKNPSQNLTDLFFSHHRLKVTEHPASGQQTGPDDSCCCGLFLSLSDKWLFSWIVPT